MNTFLGLLGITLALMALAGLGMAIGVIFRGKPIRHCGGASLSFDGEKIDCPACGQAGECKRRKAERDAARAVS